MAAFFSPSPDRLSIADISKRNIAYTLIAILLVTLVYSVFLGRRQYFKSKTYDPADSYGSVITEFANNVAKTNGAVQEGFAYLISGVVEEKEEFIRWSDSLASHPASFTQLAKRLPAQDVDIVARFSTIENLQKRMGDVAQKMFAEYETVGNVDLSTFEEFELLVDQFATQSDSLQRILNRRFLDADRALQLENSLVEQQLAWMAVGGGILILIVAVLIHRSYFAFSKNRDDALKRIGESEERFRHIFENEPHITQLIDVSGNIIEINPAGKRRLNLAEGKYNQSLFQFVDKKFHPELDRKLTGISTGCGPIQLDLVLLSPETEPFETETTLVPITSGQGDMFTILVISIDVSERIERENELRSQQNKLIHANRVNTMGELVSNVAHELNQPLTSIVNYGFLISMYADKTADKDFSSLADEIQNESVKASEIVSGLRRLVSKKDTPQTQTCLNTLVRKSNALLSNDLMDEGISLQECLDEHIPSVECDPVQIQQVYINLARNAIEAMENVKHRPKQLQVETRVNADGEPELVVRDNGTGIENTDMHHIFDAFYSQKTNGMGMGLAISRTIAESHGGRLLVNSTVAEGTEFKLILPAKLRGAA